MWKFELKDSYKRYLICMLLVFSFYRLFFYYNFNANSVFVILSPYEIGCKSNKKLKMEIGNFEIATVFTFNHKILFKTPRYPNF